MAEEEINPLSYDNVLADLMSKANFSPNMKGSERNDLEDQIRREAQLISGTTNKSGMKGSEINDVLQQEERARFKYLNPEEYAAQVRSAERNNSVTAFGDAPVEGADYDTVYDPVTNISQRVYRGQAENRALAQRLADESTGFFGDAKTLGNLIRGGITNIKNDLVDDYGRSGDTFKDFVKNFKEGPTGNAPVIPPQNIRDDDGSLPIKGGPVDETPVDDGDGDGDGEEEEIEYTQMPPFFGGYQPATRESTLVDARGKNYFQPDPRLDPIYPQRPPLDYVLHSPVIDDGPNFDFSAPANLGDTYYDPALQTTYTYQEKPDGQGGFYSGWDITEGTGGTVGLYGNSQPQGVASLFGNEQAPRSMYQGIMG